MNKTIKELCNNKPSEAILAMVRGLSNLRPNQQIDMSTYGIYDLSKQVCFGCAATFTVQELAQVQMYPQPFEFDALADEFWELTSNLTGFEYTEVEEFERAINELRIGDPEDLFLFMGLNYFNGKVTQPNKPLPILDTSNWEVNIGAYRVYATKLQELGY